MRKTRVNESKMRLRFRDVDLFFFYFLILCGIKVYKHRVRHEPLEVGGSLCLHFWLGISSAKFILSHSISRMDWLIFKNIKAMDLYFQSNDPFT